MKNIFIYNLEPRLALPVDEADRIPGIEYCKDKWDFSNMGISCFSGVFIDLKERQIHSTITAPWSSKIQETLWYIAKNPQFLIGGFNVENFEDILLYEHGLSVDCDFDLFLIIKNLVAKPTDLKSDLERLYTLDNLGETNKFPDFKFKQIAPYLYQKNETTRMLAHAQEAALNQAQLLLLLLDGLFIDPHTACGHQYKFPKGTINLGNG